MDPQHTNGHGSALPDALGQVESQLLAAKDALGDIDQKVRAFVKERPGLCVLGAVAAGFLIGRLVSRR